MKVSCTGESSREHNRSRRYTYPGPPKASFKQFYQAAHDEAGHNGFPRTYSAIRRLYYWKGIKEDVLQHCRNCYTCQLQKTVAVKFEVKHFKPSLKPMDFIAMDLISEFHPPSSQGNRYALTGVCILTGFTWCIPIKLKKANRQCKSIYTTRLLHAQRQYKDTH